MRNKLLLATVIPVLMSGAVMAEEPLALELGGTEAITCGVDSFAITTPLSPGLESGATATATAEYHCNASSGTRMRLVSQNGQITGPSNIPYTATVPTHGPWGGFSLVANGSTVPKGAGEELMSYDSYVDAGGTAVIGIVLNDDPTAGGLYTDTLTFEVSVY
mgnify:CR=1 FL=1